MSGSSSGIEKRAGLPTKWEPPYRNHCPTQRWSGAGTPVHSQGMVSLLTGTTWKAPPQVQLRSDQHFSRLWWSTGYLHHAVWNAQDWKIDIACPTRACCEQVPCQPLNFSCCTKPLSIIWLFTVQKYVNGILFLFSSRNNNFNCIAFYRNTNPQNRS